MRLVMIYREKSDYRMTVETFLHDYRVRTGQDIETLDPDSREGANMCQTYDIVEYPTLIAIGPDGMMYQMWRGVNLPTVSEVAMAAQQ